MTALPLSEARLLPLAAVGVLLALLVLVLILVVKTIRKGAAANAANATAAARSALLSEMEAPAIEDPDVTRLKAFSADLLPRLSLDDDDDDADGDGMAIEDSKPVLHLEDNATVDATAAPTDLIVTSAASKSDRGMKRTRNEDACLVDGKLDLYVVADGMGGYAGGDIAANTAVAEVHKALKPGSSVKNLENKAAVTPADWPSPGRELSLAIERANDIIRTASGSDKTLEGMGTTILTARFSRRMQRLYAAYVGDTRLYRLREGKLRQLTVDHTLGAKGVTGPLASNIRRAVGVSPSVKVDLLIDKPLADDLYMLCSDGAYKMVAEPEMLRILAHGDTLRGVWREDELKEKVSSIVKAANAAGGKDNITVVLVGISDPALAQRPAAKSVETHA